MVLNCQQPLTNMMVMVGCLIASLVKQLTVFGSDHGNTSPLAV